MTTVHAQKRVAWKTAQTEAPKVCMACGAKTKAPEILRPDWHRLKLWPNTLFYGWGSRRVLMPSGSWVVLCARCPAVHVWSWGNVYKLFTDPMPGVVLGGGGE